MLSPRDEIGLNYESANIEGFKGLGFGKYIAFKNPVNNAWAWKRRVGHGVDQIIIIGDYHLYIEDKYCMTDYPYRKDWYHKTVEPRFKDYPRDKYHIHIVLTNRPNNFNSIQSISKGIYYYIFSKLIIVINKLVNQYVNNNDYNNKLTDNNQADNNNQCVTGINYDYLLINLPTTVGTDSLLLTISNRLAEVEGDSDHNSASIVAIAS